jgi:hypothetical protein
MLDVGFAILAAGCAVLSVAVAGLLRRITDVKLTLGGYTDEPRPFMIDMGRMLPQRVLQEIPRVEEDALILLGSASCHLCHDLLAEVGALRRQVVVGVVPERDGTDGSPLVIGSRSATLTEEATIELTRAFEIDQVPVAIVQRDGYVVGASYGADLESTEKLQQFWEMFGENFAEVGG